MDDLNYNQTRLDSIDKTIERIIKGNKIQCRGKIPLHQIYVKKL